MGDKFDSLNDVRIVEVANISLEPEMEVVELTHDGVDGQGNGDDDLVLAVCKYAYLFYSFALTVLIGIDT